MYTLKEQKKKEKLNENCLSKNHKLNSTQRNSFEEQHTTLYNTAYHIYTIHTNHTYMWKQISIAFYRVNVEYILPHIFNLVVVAFHIHSKQFQKNTIPIYTPSLSSQKNFISLWSWLYILYTTHQYIVYYM